MKDVQAKLILVILLMTLWPLSAIANDEIRPDSSIESNASINAYSSKNNSFINADSSIGANSDAITPKSSVITPNDSAVETSSRSDDVSSASAGPENEINEQLVQEILEQDIRQALENTKQSHLGKSSNTPFLAPRLVALYGVGKALMAEVQVGNQAYLYVKGQAYPAGYKGDKRVYQLKAMNGACVQLEKGMDKHSLCLRMLLGENHS